MKNTKSKIIIKGKLTDTHTRCVHYHSPLDVIAIKFKCCNQYFACYYCHQEEAGHEHTLWQKTEFGTKAIICGICFSELTITQYKASNYQCLVCKTAFNPKCENHHHLYFER